MGSLYRSEVMRLCQMIISKESAYDCVSEIGKAGSVHFNDLNSSKSVFQRTFVRDVRRCEELQRRLRFLQRQLNEAVPKIKQTPMSFDDLEVPSIAQIRSFEPLLLELEKSIRELNNNDDTMRIRLNEMREYQYVLQKVELFFQVKLEVEANREITDAEHILEEANGEDIKLIEVPPSSPLPEHEDDRESWFDESRGSIFFRFISGVIPTDKKIVFERVIWRACRRTAFVRMADIDDEFVSPESHKPIRKSVFIVFFKGQSLKLIVEKVCEGFQARQYPCPKSSKDRQTALFDAVTRVQDLDLVINTTALHKHEILTEIADKLPKWEQQVHLHKAVYHVMNYFTVDMNGFMAAECWIAEKDLEQVKLAMHHGARRFGTTPEPILNVLDDSGQTPPTFNRINKFTRVFQSIVDSYGIASYREINPAPYTIVTFPFLFAVMFGDFAHGIILLLAGLAFILKEDQILKKRIKGEIFQTFFGGRYIIALMGAFSIYTGLVYNDGFGRSVNVFGSSWAPRLNATELDRLLLLKKDVKRELFPDYSFDSQRGPYYFGVDPIWNVADNKLTFLNSMKMKASVIIGVSQMAFGVFLSFLNHAHSCNFLDMFANFVPQIVFLSSIFVYLCVQIVTKWLFFGYSPGTVFGMPYEGAKCAPSLLIGLINMFMQKSRGVGAHSNGSSSPCFLNFWYPEQRRIEQILLLLALACIPVMLLVKPAIELVILKIKRKKRDHLDDELLPPKVRKSESKDNLSDHTKAASGDDNHDTTDIIVHQAIHTIEFVLGCVSHTASYLRLWALSLAHAQLSEVLWDMVLMKALVAVRDPYLSPVVAFVASFVFTVLTVSILVLMEGLSAFLHALRLHWVEFQSKFYVGDGYPFVPFSLVQSIEYAVAHEAIEETTVE